MAESDDLQQEYRERPQESLSERFEKAQARRERQREDARRVRAAIAKERELPTRSYAGDVSRGLISGPLRAFEEMGQTIGDLGDWLNENVADLGVISSEGFLSNEDFEARGGRSIVGDVDITPEALETETLPGNLTQGVTQFLTGWFAGPARAIQVGQQATRAGRVGAAAARGAVVDASSFDPQEERLSNLIQENPSLRNPVSEFLAANEDDSIAEGRLKNALEGLGLGIAMDGLILAVKAVRASRRAKDLKAVEEEVVAERIEIPEPKRAEEPDLDTPEGTAKPDPEVPADEVLTNPERFRQAVEIPPEAQARLVQAIEADDMSTARELIDFNEQRVDWDSMGDDAGDIRALLNTVSEQIEDVTQGAATRGGVQTNRETVRLAHLVGAKAEEVHSLFNDVVGEGPGLTARVLAAERTMIASARQLKALAQTASETGAKADLAVFHRQVEIHMAIQAEIKGSKREVARALQAMSILKKAEAEEFSEFDDIVKTLGGHSGGFSGHDRLLKQLLAAKDLGDLNNKVRTIAGRRVVDVVSEIAINGLLSSPKTHVINMTSNTLNAGLGAIDRYVAAAIGRGYKWRRSDADVIALSEARAYSHGALTGMREGLRLAARAFKEQRPISDPRQRIEFDTRKAIRVDTDGLTGNSLKGAQAINALGDVIRFPGTMLVVEDEFFKTVSRNAYLAAEANRRAHVAADAKKLTGNRREKFLAKYQADFMSNPPSEVARDAVESARYNTFQELPTTAFGQATERFLNASPWFKLVVAPFVRTPLNILRQVFVDRSPLALSQKEIRDAIKAGGPEGQLALARITLGTAGVLSGLTLAASGKITGGGAGYNNTERLSGIPPYSVNIGGNWYQYSRLDPAGSWLATSADFHEAMTRYYDREDPERVSAFAQAGQALVLAMARNALDKTWTKSLDDILNVLSDDNSPVQAEGKLKKLTGDQLNKLVPFSSLFRSVAQTQDPVVRQAQEISERLSRGIPGESSELPPIRDYLGREIVRQNHQWHWINPFASSAESDDPLDQELARLSYDFSPIPASLDGVNLTTRQRSDFLKFIGQERYEQFGGRTLEDLLRAHIQTPAYRNATESDFDTGGKEAQLKAIYSGAKSLAKRRLLAEYPDLAARIRDRKVRAAELLRGNSPSPSP
ncbi:MAG: hypothetical protein AAF628_08340 [Planctomycetota bacterium]